jgi:hypothetical protein
MVTKQGKSVESGTRGLDLNPVEAKTNGRGWRIIESD